MFTDNKYTKCYFSIIEKAAVRGKDGYTENHHIIPHSMNGPNKKDNLVRLTAREHFICHWLLVKMVSGKDKRKMQLALMKMCNISPTHQRYSITSKMYERVRKNCAGASTGSNNPMYGKNHTLETRAKMSAKAIEYNKLHPKQPISQEHKDKISKANTGRRPTLAVREEWSRKRKGRAGQDNNSGRHWYNDGQSSYLKFECPEGFTPGRL